MIPKFSIDDRRAFVRLEAISPATAGALAEAVGELVGPILADAKSRAAAHIHTQGKNPGAYLDSIYGGVSERPGKVIGFVRSDSPLAHLLEDGAHIPAHDILPKSAADVLAFNGDAGTVFARVVHSPGANVPAYPAIYPSLDAAQSDIESKLEGAVRDAVRGA